MEGVVVLIEVGFFFFEVDLCELFVVLVCCFAD